MSALRVLHVITCLFRGGAETMLYKLAAELPLGAGFEHSVISLMDGSQFDFASLGVPVRSLGLVRGLPTPAALWRLRQMIVETGADLIQGWMYHGNTAASLAASGVGRPLVWGIHHSLHDLSAEKPLTRLLIRSGSRLARQHKLSRIVYCSEASRVQHEAIGYPSHKSVYIPNGFDCQRFVPDPEARRRLRAALGLDEDTVLIGNVARFHPIKNHVGMIQAFSSIAERHPRARLLFAGLGLSAENGPLMQAIRRVGHEDRIILLGERDDIPRVFAALDLLLLGSRSEGFPNVLGEAMACGVPCVTTDVGDAARIVGDTGLVAPAGDDAAMAMALERALSYSEGERKALGMRARSRIVDNYSMAVVAGRYASLYREVVDSTRSERAGSARR